MNVIKELPLEFNGRGKVKLFTFRQIAQSDKAYLYEVNNSNSRKHYEVFKRKINSQYNCVSYPKSKSFGTWAWSCDTLTEATEKFNEVNTK